MKIAMRRIRGLLVVLSLAVAAGPLPVRAGENYALLVGVADYDEKELRPLKFTRADVQEFHAALLDSGFKAPNVILLHDDFEKLVAHYKTLGADYKPKDYIPTGANIRRELALVLGRLRADDSVIVAFAGHGVQYKSEKKSYFCPADAVLEKKESLIGFDEVFTAMKECAASRKLFVVDACQDTPQSLISRSRNTVDLDSVTRPQSEPVPEGIIALFSCKAGQRAFEHPPLGHGVFFYHLLDGWKGKADENSDGKLSYQELAVYTERKTSEYAALKLKVLQTPLLKNEFSGGEWVLRELGTSKTLAIHSLDLPRDWGLVPWLSPTAMISMSSELEMPLEEYHATVDKLALEIDDHLGTESRRVVNIERFDDLSRLPDEFARFADRTRNHLERALAARGIKAGLGDATVVGTWSEEADKDSVAILLETRIRRRAQKQKTVGVARFTCRRKRLRALRGFVVAVDRYRGGNFTPLQYSCSDAEKLVKFLLRRNGTTYKIAEKRDGIPDITFLRNEEVTLANTTREIEALRERSKKGSADDLLLIYVTGHGVAIQNDYYFVPPQVTATEASILKRDAISWDLLSSLTHGPCRKLYIMDTDAAGSIRDSYSLRTPDLKSGRFRENRFAILAASFPGGLAMEGRVFRGGHGAFTASLLASLAEADREGNDRVSVAEMAYFIGKDLPNMTGEHQFPSVIPDIETLAELFRDVELDEPAAISSPVQFDIGRLKPSGK